VDANLFIAIIGALGIPSILAALVLRKLSKMEKKEELRQATKLRENLLMFRAAETTGQLAKSTALAVAGCACNHSPVQLSTAIRAYNKTYNDLQQFMMEQAARANQ
jgi:hypothetical protein